MVQKTHTFLLENSTADELKRNEDCPLLLEGGGVGGHGARSDPSDVGVVPPAGYKEHRPARSSSEHLAGGEKDTGTIRVG